MIRDMKGTDIKGLPVRSENTGRVDETVVMVTDRAPSE